MDNDHGITGELREWIRTVTWLDDSPAHKNITAIADRIDAALAERYIELPKDADGEYIHIGDKVDSDHHEDGTVTGVQFYEMANGGIRTLVAVRPGAWDVATWRTPDEYRHYHAPTVEDVLFEFAQFWSDEELTDIEHLQPHAAQTIAEYAAKLRLAGDAE